MSASIRSRGVADRSYPLEQRFLSRINKTATCWIWTGTIATFGYGALNHQHKRYSAHRFSYEFHVGPIPDGMAICHRCDNPPCVNPEHLFLGTQANNLHDMKTKGRAKGPGLKGEEHGGSKLTTDDVVQIKQELRIYQRGDLKRLAEKFKVHICCISDIKAGRRWTHVVAP